MTDGNSNTIFDVEFSSFRGFLHWLFRMKFDGGVFMMNRLWWNRTIFKDWFLLKSEFMITLFVKVNLTINHDSFWRLKGGFGGIELEEKIKNIYNKKSWRLSCRECSCPFFHFILSFFKVLSSPKFPCIKVKFKDWLQMLP